jgi:hypothetical protein
MNFVGVCLSLVTIMFIGMLLGTEYAFPWVYKP